MLIVHGVSKVRKHCRTNFNKFGEHFPSRAFPTVRAWTLKPKHFFDWYKDLAASL